MASGRKEKWLSMQHEGTLRITVALIVLVAPGCTALRELPRDQYAVKNERQNVRVDTQEGLHYEFESVRFAPDTLFGEHRKDSEGQFDEFDELAIPLDRVSRISTRHVDWYRTGLIGGT